MTGKVLCAGIIVADHVCNPISHLPAAGELVTTDRMLLTIGGCLCLAWVLAQLAGRIDGGPYAYARAVAGDSAAFAVMWSYWISIWTAVPALAIAAISYLSRIVPALGAPVVAPTVAVAAVWALTLVNMGGARAAGAVQLRTTVLKGLPLCLVFHFQEIDHHRPTHIAQAQLTGDLLPGIHIDRQLAAFVRAAVHINRGKGCRFLNDDDAAFAQHGIRLE